MAVTNETGVLAADTSMSGAGLLVRQRRGVRRFCAASHLTFIDLLGMVAGFVFCLLVSLALGHKRIFWEDEMLGWMLLRDPSFHHMVQNLPYVQFRYKK